MLLNGHCHSDTVPVEVSLTLSGMANSKTRAWDAQGPLSHQPVQAESHSLESGSLSKQRSTSSSRASLEASIDALVDVQLARLAEAAKEPDVGELAKRALVRTASAPEVPEAKPVLAQTSGLDWSGSIEAGPALIGSRQAPGTLQEAENPQGTALPHKAKSEAAPLISLNQEPLVLAGEGMTSPLGSSPGGPSPKGKVDDSHIPAPEGAQSRNLSRAGSGKPPKGATTMRPSLAPTASVQAYESPFEAAQFQDEPIIRAVVVPEVEPDDVWKSASVPPSQVPSLLAGGATEQQIGLNDQRASHILRDVVQLLKGASEASNLSPAEQTRPSPPRTSLEVPETQQGYTRQAGMKSLSLLETEGIPLIRNGTLTLHSEWATDWETGVLEQPGSTTLRQNLAQEGGFGHSSHHYSRPTSAMTARSLTVPSAELRKALEELNRERLSSPSSLATVPSDAPYIPASAMSGDDDMAAPNTLQHDIIGFQPADDLMSVRSPPRAPSLFDLTAPSLTQESAEWLIPWDEIELGRRIGAGSYGEVFRAQWRHTDVAVKRIHNTSESTAGLADFKSEVNLMSKLKHPNIVQFLGACTEYPNLSIVTQFMPRGSLFNLLHRAKVQLDYRQKLWMALDVAKGMHYLHSCRPPIVHGDVSSKNMLVDRDFTIRVADFGMSRQRRKAMLSAKSQGGTAEWTAPEVLRGLPYHEKADVFSFGVILFELMTQTAPWSELSTIQVVGAVGWGNAHLQVPENIPRPMKVLMTACLERDPQKRPDFEQVIVSLRDIRKNVQLTPVPIQKGSRRSSMETRAPGHASREDSLEKPESEANEIRAKRSASLESRRTM